MNKFVVIKISVLLMLSSLSSFGNIQGQNSFDLKDNRNFKNSLSRIDIEEESFQETNINADGEIGISHAVIFKKNEEGVLVPECRINLTEVENENMIPSFAFASMSNSRLNQDLENCEGSVTEEITKITPYLSLEVQLAIAPLPAIIVGGVAAATCLLGGAAGYAGGKMMKNELKSEGAALSSVGAVGSGAYGYFSVKNYTKIALKQVASRGTSLATGGVGIACSISGTLIAYFR